MRIDLGVDLAFELFFVLDAVCDLWSECVELRRS